MNPVAIKGIVHRREFVRRLIAACPDVLIVSGLGSSTYDVFSAGDRPENFYLWGAMGGAAAVGLGLAIAQPNRSVLVITGDGEQLMGLGSLCTIGAQKPKNLNLVVIDNGHYGETGMQLSHTSLGTDLAAVARACSITRVEEITDIAQVSNLANKINTRETTLFAQVFVGTDELSRTLPSRDGVHIKNRFRGVFGLQPI